MSCVEEQDGRLWTVASRRRAKSGGCKSGRGWRGRVWVVERAKVGERDEANRGEHQGGLG